MAIFCLYLIAHNFTCNKKVSIWNQVECFSVIFRIPFIISCLGVFYSDCGDHKIPSFYGAQRFVIIFRKTWQYILSYALFLFLWRLYCGNYRSSIFRGIRIHSPQGFWAKMYEFLIYFVRVGVPTILSPLISTNLLQKLLFMTLCPACRFFSFTSPLY
jgi:hypothetical protein